MTNGNKDPPAHPGALVTPHRGPSRQRHRRDGPVAAAAGPPSGAFPLPCATPVRLPPDVPPSDRPAGADGARVVAPRPHRPVPARKGPPLMVPLARHGRALTPRPTHHVARGRAWVRSGGRCVCGRGRRSPPPSRRRPSRRPASRASRRPPFRSCRTAPSCDASASTPHGTRDTGTCATDYPCPWFPPLPDGAAAQCH